MFDLEMGRVPPFSEGYFLIASGHLHVYTRTRGQEFYRDRGHFWFSQHQDHPHVVVVNTF